MKKVIAFLALMSFNVFASWNESGFITCENARGHYIRTSYGATLNRLSVTELERIGETWSFIHNNKRHYVTNAICSIEVENK